MDISEDYLELAEECDRLAATCVSFSNRSLLLIAARQWRRMAQAEQAPEPTEFLRA